MMAGSRRPKKQTQPQDGSQQKQEDRLQAFLEWMSGVGITWSEAIKFEPALAACSGASWGITAAADVREGDLLAQIPKSAVLSVRNTTLADVLALEGIRGGLGLTIAVLHEYTMGEKSRWFGYFKSLPPREYLPLFWSDQELSLLEGTDLEGRPQEDRELTESDFEEHVAPLAAKYPKRVNRSKWTLENFRIAASWVASRAFCVDAYHGDAMVPLADVFNHKASVVALNDEYQVAEEAAGGGSDEDEDEDDEDEGIEEEEGEGEEEASEGEDEGELEGAEGEEEGQEEDEHHDGCGGCAHHAHHHHTSTCTKGGAPRTSKAAGTVGSTAAHDSSQHGIPVLHKQHPSEPGSVQEPLEAGEPQKKLVQHQGPLLLGGVDLRLHIAICDAPDASEAADEEGGDDEGEEEEEGGSLHIVAACDVPAGQEVFNTYGEHGNAELVSKYGFCLPRNPFNEVALDKSEMMQAVEDALVQAHLQHTPPHELHKGSSARGSGKGRTKAAAGAAGGADAAAEAAARKQVQRVLHKRRKLLEDTSDLLEDDQEPWAVLPAGEGGTSGTVSSPLYLALLILAGPEELVGRLEAVSDALELTPAPSAIHRATTAGKPATNTNSRKRSREVSAGGGPDPEGRNSKRGRKQQEDQHGHPGSTSQNSNPSNDEGDEGAGSGPDDDGGSSHVAEALCQRFSHAVTLPAWPTPGHTPPPDPAHVPQGHTPFGAAAAQQPEGGASWAHRKKGGHNTASPASQQQQHTSDTQLVWVPAFGDTQQPMVVQSTVNEQLTDAQGQQRDVQDGSGEGHNNQESRRWHVWTHTMASALAAAVRMRLQRYDRASNTEGAGQRGSAGKKQLGKAKGKSKDVASGQQPAADGGPDAQHPGEAGDVGSLAQDAAELAALQKSATRTEGTVARMAALGLRVTEQQDLASVLRACTTWAPQPTVNI